MKLTNRYLYLLVVLVLCALGAGIFAARVAAQEDRWLIVRADYGFRNQRSDVTDIVKDLIERGGVNGRVAVTNQTMGGDPAVGRDKSLRIFAKNRRNEERQFNFNEGGFVDARLFEVRPPEVHREDADDRRPNDRDRDDRRPGNGDRDRDERRDMTILRAYYGIQGRTVDVTELLRSRVRDGRLNFPVTNGALGGDPAIGADKVLIVVYRTQGYETATAVREGFTLAIP
jgi:hypothetical protein